MRLTYHYLTVGLALFEQQNFDLTRIDPPRRKRNRIHVTSQNVYVEKKLLMRTLRWTSEAWSIVPTSVCSCMQLAHKGYLDHWY